SVWGADDGTIRRPGKTTLFHRHIASDEASASVARGGYRGPCDTFRGMWKYIIRLGHGFQAALVIALLCFTAAGSASAAQQRTLPPIRHVFLIVLENKSFEGAFGPGSPAPYLAKSLPARGALLTQYYATGHWSLDNYIALVSGQAPNP